MLNTSSVKFYTLSYKATETYIIACLFVLGNILLPQLLHQIPLGGKIWLPLYLFTLIGAYKYGWKVGLLTAIFSPIINCVGFGMPAPSVLPAILLKSTLLAVFAGIAANRFKKASIWTLAGVVLSYQFAGTLGEWMIEGDFFLAVQDFRIGIPGMLLQIFGSWLIINLIIRR